ncbi:DNA/RNA non-specific endonuclease [Agromyces sp. CFH 90414]|uniref:DNA/RNA non-specific endonuclease n=1 Tax=Agromyces agglutinans TaxID=2662258 RepID=A0A6I2FAY5_9MICO|nr:DNA/RNA non-specific endonuclease [Agromyces agglutinans]MRG59900.1 DNA/RNA non-specific endonuclease [Agromyces agglutinans]
MGFDARFLGVEAALPRVPESEADATVELDYVHFTVLLDTARRLARVTGVNVDGASLIDLARGDDWQLDDRVPADWQAGPEVYAANDLDRGHLVRRRDPVWGARPVATRANADTFRYPNAAPQASGFNQSKELWLGLEDHVLAFAEVNDLKLSVCTAPVLEPGDPAYRGIRVPLRFWKVVAWRTDGAADVDRSDDGATVDGGALAAAGFVLDQAPVLDEGELERGARPVEPGVAGVPQLGPFRTFQVPIADLAALTGLGMDEYVAADRFPPTLAATGWRRLDEPGDVML